MTQTIQIGNRIIGAGHPTFVIAEAGINHNGQLGLALQMVDAAKQAGADCVKFQVIYPERYISRVAPLAEYMRRANDSRQESQLDLLKRSVLTDDEFRIVKAHCDECGIMFLATPFDETAADFLDSIGVLAFKIPSGEIDNLRFLQHVARKGKPMIVSTGMATLGEIEDTLYAISEAGNQSIALLHCTSGYPPDDDDANMTAIIRMYQAFGLPVGYSDHYSDDIIGAVMSVAYGAVIYETHFTLDRNLPGPDQNASREYLGLAVSAIRKAERRLGNGIKRLMPSEANTRDAARKSIVAARDIGAGERLTDGMLALKRPGTGLRPGACGYITGRTALRNIAADSLIRLEDLA
jgi:N-acetylneuraminate synthase/N,N'-diacetyllegionaminate synthase